MADKAAKRGLFSPLKTHEDALKTVRDSAMAFFVLAGVQGLIGVFLAPSILIDAVVFAVLGFILMKRHSRVVAVLLLVLSIGEAIVTVLNRMGVTSQGGSNVILAGIMVIAAVRAVEATFKLRGRLAAVTAGMVG